MTILELIEGLVEVDRVVVGDDDIRHEIYYFGVWGLERAMRLRNTKQLTKRNG